MAPTTKRVPGMSVKTAAAIFKTSKNCTIENPDDIFGVGLPVGTLGRIHSQEPTGFRTWYLDEGNYKTIYILVPWSMAGEMLVPHEHGIFPHLKS